MTHSSDYLEHNRGAWNRLASGGCQWSEPASDAAIEEARHGRWSLTVAGPDELPRHWWPDVADIEVLCLAAGGGQHASLLAAAGAAVTLFDLSDNQLAVDRDLCARHNLSVRIEQGDMTDLSRFGESSFDLIINPVSNPYVPDVEPVWRACARVLKSGGRLIAGSINPLNYLFEENTGEVFAEKAGEGNAGEGRRGLTVTHALPFIEIDTLTPAAREAALARGMVLTWSHSLTALIDGQLRAGLNLAGLQESRRRDARAPAINRYAPTYLSTLAFKP